MEILGLFVITLTADNMYSPHNCGKLPQWLQTQLAQKAKTIPIIFVAFLESTWNFVSLGKEDQLHSLNISKVIDSKKCSYMDAKKQLFQNTLREWTCSRVPNTVQILMAPLLLWFFVNPKKVEFQNMSLNQIEGLRTVC